MDDIEHQLTHSPTREREAFNAAAAAVVVALDGLAAI